MSKKMWNKIFKNKPIKPAVSAVKSPSNENNRYSYYEEFYNTCTVPPFKESSNSTSGKSKFSLVVNSFSLKRNSKENNNSRKNNTNNNKNKSVFNKQSNDDDGDFKTPMDLTPTDAIDSVSSTKVSTEPNINIPEEPEKLELHPCRICNRTFVPRTLAKHVVICEKTAIKKRKQFDSLRQRTEGTELADYVPKKFGLPITTFPERSISPKPKLTVPVVKAEPEKILIKKPEVVTEPEVEPITETIERKTAPVAKGTLNRQKANTPIRESIRKRNLVPDSTQCPHCSRFFGVKAYERHYIWCKEKSLDIATKNLGVTQAAKERLEARVNYRAPNLKTKRAVNREKYSGINDDDVSLKNSKLMCTSLGSSFMSDGGLSDKYDPFQSAKRQLEELCSPPSPEQHQKFVHSPNTKTFTRSKLSPGKFTTPYNSINSSPSTNPKVALSAIKSNFRRTSSLRSPRKAAFLASRPIYQPNTLRPTIQRGLSDEGPISSNFLKPEEYDEMPVRSVCSNDFAITNSPRVIRRDSSASNRRILGLNLPKENSPTTLQNNKISKTDSLAIFLKYENDAKTIDSPVTTKDLKDKSNTLSKQNSAKNITNEIEEKTFIEENDVNSTKSTLLLQPQPSPQPKRYDTCMTVNKINSIRLDPLPTKFLVNHSTPKQQSPKQIQTSETLNSSTFSNSVNLNSIFDTKHISDDFIDPKLINDIDNLPINVTKLSSDSDLTSNVSSDTGNHQKLTVSDTQSQYNDSQSPPIQDYQHQYQQQNEQQQKQIQQPNAPIPNKPLTDTSSNRNSTDNRNLLKRKMRVGRNQFLYDASPESDLDNESNNSLDDEQNRTLNTLSMNDKKQTSPPTIPPFDEFDFEEFLSSFENDTEQFPLFKDCREFLMSRTHNKQQQSSSSDKNNKIDIDSICSDLPYNNKNININNNNNNNNNVENDNDNVKNNNYTMLFDRSSPIHVTENNKLSDNEEDEEDKRHEIFISIETDQNDNDSINSSHCNSLSGKQIALVEEIDANDNKFTKIIDDGTSGDYNKNSKKIRKLPDVKRNNAKNLLLHDYHQSNEKIVKHESIENIHSSHHSIESKSSNASKKRPSTSATPEMLRYQQSFVKHPPTHKQPTLIRRSASSSSSENSLPPINSTTNMDILMKSLTVSSFKDSKRCEKNSNRSVSPTISTKTLTPNMANINSKKNKLPVTTSSKTSCNSSKNGRISKFCHECGSKFMLETAKFCMDCGVKRIIV